MDERSYWLGFSVFSGIGPVKFSSLLKKFGNAKEAWSAKQTDLNNVLGEKLANKFEDFRKEFSIENYLKKLEKKKVSFITKNDKEYPKLLKEIEKPPFVLYIKCHSEFISGSNNLPAGKAGMLKQVQHDNERIAVVGTRKITQYGREVTEIFTRELVEAGFTIVSGLAIGVDSIAHKTAVENGGKTIAVLGCGVDCCTPISNQYLYDKIIDKGGAVISEVPLSYLPTKGSFPARNRIIAGLSLGVLVTEGAEDSGSLITAEHALSESRRVFAVPGPITSSLSKGPFKLIQKGAKLVTSAEDIIREFQISNIKFQIPNKSQIQNTKRGENKEEELILKILENEKLHFDEIARKAKMNPSKAGSILSVMEIKGLVKSLDGGFYSLNVQ